MEQWLVDIADEIAIDSLPENYRLVAETMGMRDALRLVLHLAGVQIYVPHLKKMIQAKRDERIRAEFTGANHRALALRYGLTEVWIRRIVQAKAVQQKQLSLFD